MFRIMSTVWLNFLPPDFALASLTALMIVFLSKGIFRPRANEDLEPDYKNIRLCKALDKRFGVLAFVNFFLDFSRVFAVHSCTHTHACSKDFFGCALQVCGQKFCSLDFRDSNNLFHREIA